MSPSLENSHKLVIYYSFTWLYRHPSFFSLIGWPLIVLSSLYMHWNVFLKVYFDCLDTMLWNDSTPFNQMHGSNISNLIKKTGTTLNSSYVLLYRHFLFFFSTVFIEKYLKYWKTFFWHKTPLLHFLLNIHLTF